MPWSFYQTFSQHILEPFSFLTQIAQALVTLVVPIIGAVLVIKVMIYGYEVLRGQVSQSVLLELVFKNIRPMMVISIALAGGAYAANIVPMIEELRTTLTSLFTQTHVANSYAALDMSMDRALQSFNYMTDYAWEKHVRIGLNESDFTGLLTILCAVLMIVSLLLYSVIAAAQLLVIDVMLKVLLAIGPLFIAAFVFPATARFFDSWLATVLKYVVTAALIMLVVGVGNGIFDHYTTLLQGGMSVSEGMGDAKAAFYSVAASGLLIYFTLKIPALGGDMLGGAGISVFSPSAVTKPLGNLADKATKPAREAAGNYIGGKVSAGATAMKQMVSRAIRPSGAGSISGAASQAQFPRSRGARPAGQSMQSMLEKRK